MTTYRRLLTVVLITLSCLFAIQPAGAANAQATDDDSCSNIGPTMFSLGLSRASSSALASVPPCYSLEAASSDGAGSAASVRVPIEGSLLVLDETPAFVIAAEHQAAVASAAQDQLPSRPDQIGPTI